MGETYNITLNNIDVEDGRRQVDQSKVEAIAESIKQIGLQTPPTVRIVGDGERIVLVAGAHRLAAMKLLGWETAMLPILPDHVDHRLWEIDENLCRSELTPTERADLTARRKAIYEELHPETVNGSNQYTRVGQLGQPSADRFTQETAKVTGQSERKVRRDAERGAKVCEEAKALIKGTPLDTGAYLDRLKKLSPEEQVSMINRELQSRDKAKAKTDEAAETTKANAAADKVRRTADASDCARWVAERMASEDALALASWLDRLPAKEMAKAIRREVT
ncbi:MAG: ParB N-terminal domain-containing protein [Devosia sp.]